MKNRACKKWQGSRKAGQKETQPKVTTSKQDAIGAPLALAIPPSSPNITLYLIYVGNAL